MHLMRLFGILADAGGPPAAAVVTVSGENVDSTVGTTSAQSIAGIKVGANGVLYRRNGNTYTAIDTGTDWIIPRGAAAGHECRITNVVWNNGGSFTRADAAEDVWIPISGDPEWYVQDINIGVSGIKDVDFDLEIRYGSSGGALDSGPFNLHSEWEAL